MLCKHCLKYVITNVIQIHFFSYRGNNMLLLALFRTWLRLSAHLEQQLLSTEAFFQTSRNYEALYTLRPKTVVNVAETKLNPPLNSRSLLLLIIAFVN